MFSYTFVDMFTKFNLPCPHFFQSSPKTALTKLTHEISNQGILTEDEGSVQLTSSLR